MAYREDGSGASVTLVVPPSAVRPHPSPTGTPTSVISNPRPHLPFTGFDASTALILMTLLLALGVAFLATGRRSATHRRT